MYQILICDDQPEIVNALEIYLSSDGYRLLTAYSGQQALEILKTESVDLVLMDIMMPVMDGITAVAKLREFSDVPVIFLTAKSETEDLVLGLNIGADDYITKPFVPVELLARVRSQLRRYSSMRTQPALSNQLQAGGVVIDDEAKAVWVDSEQVSLTPLEYSILKLLVKNPGRVFSTRELYEAVWQAPALGSEGAVAVHIRHLREKIEIDPSNPRHLKVIWGQGYKLEGGK